MEYTHWMKTLGDVLSPTVQAVIAYLPTLISFFGLILIGWILARVLEFLASRFVRGVDRIVRIPTLKTELKEAGIESTAPQVIGKIIFWTVLILFIAAATEALGLAVMSRLLGGIAYYLPNILAAVLIGLFGYLGSVAARKAVFRAATTAQIVYGDFLARGTQVLILGTTALIAIDQIGIDINFLMILITIVVGTTFGGMALAFGLGSTTIVSNMLASHYLQRTYQVGQVVRIDNIQGRIVELTPAAVILETADGRVLMPAREFSEKHSVLITGGS
jgi:hypothetical protein